MKNNSKTSNFHTITARFLKNFKTMPNFDEKKFLKNLDNCPIIVIFWPTWCGKTAFSLQIAKILEKNNFLPFIISTDSRQIYREMNIGTGKILPHQMENILHYGLDIINPNETFSVVDFRENIENSPLFAEWKNLQRNKNFTKKIIPIICGGTGLYIDSLIFKRNYLWSEPNMKKREELENFREKFGNEALWQKLNEIDPKYAKTLHPNNHTYIIRGIEIFEETGKSKLESIDEKPELKYPTIFLTPYTDNPENRQNLYNKINSRIDEMFDDGLVNEVENIIKIFWKNSVWLKTIGYKEIIHYLNGEISLEEAKNLVAQHNRNYAKRQITWNNKKYSPLLKEYIFSEKPE